MDSQQTEKTAPEGRKSAGILRRLFEIYKRAWASEFDFQKCDKFFHPINKSIVYTLSGLVARGYPEDNCLLADANGDPRWISDLRESVEEAIKKSGVTKSLYGSMWMDAETGFIYAIAGQNAMGCLILWQPNSTTYAMTDISLPGMVPADPLQAIKLFEKNKIEQHRKMVAEYDHKQSEKQNV